MHSLRVLTKLQKMCCAFVAQLWIRAARTGCVMGSIPIEGTAL